MEYSNSPLATYRKISPNRNSPRNHAIDRITPHCYVGQVSVEDMCAWLASPAAKASANYCIGKDGRVGLNVEEGDRAWTSSSASNDNRAVTIECASDKDSPYKINDVVYNRLVELMTDICRRNGKTKLLWFGNKDKTLSYAPAPHEMVLTVHRWFANKACPGDYIYNRLGKMADEVTLRLSGKPNGIPASKQIFIEQVGKIASSLMQGTQILASVVTAQCCLETGYGLGNDALELVKVNNLLGMKTDLINSTWQQWSCWDGKEITKRTPEYHNGQLVYVTDHFRTYPDYEKCILDYEMFLLHVRNDKGYKYACVAGMTDPAAVIRRIRIGTGTPAHPEGYCTDPNYEAKVLRIIEENNLTRFDGPQRDKYAVQRSLEDRHRLGLFKVLENAKAQADKNWGYKVFDIEDGSLVYEPLLRQSEKFVARLNEMDQTMQDDNSDKHYWTYCNTGGLSRTFDKARKEANRKTNCVTGVQWALLSICGRDGIQWYGNKGIVWLTDHARADAEKYFRIIDAKGKRLKDCIADGTVKLGDTITYKDLSHTNAYFGAGLSFDAGHAFCDGSGEGARFKKWIGSTPYQTYKVAQVLRPYDTWRVQCGVFTNQKNATSMAAKLRKVGFDVMIVNEGKQYIVQSGLYDYKINAEKQAAKIKAAGFDCLVKGIG